MSATKLILTSDEIKVCQKMSSQKDLFGKRALALLAIHEGATHPQAAEKAGLSNGQVMYLMRTFREKGINIFTHEVLQSDNGSEKEKLKIDEITPVAVEEPAAVKAEKIKQKSKKKKKEERKKKKSRKKDKKEGKKLQKKKNKKDKKKKDKKKQAKGKKAKQKKQKS